MSRSKPCSAPAQTTTRSVIHYSSRPLYDTHSKFIVNTINTHGAMGKGVAKWFRQAYPEMYQVYRRLCETGEIRIGRVFVWWTQNHAVINLPTKRHWKNPSRPEDIEVGLKVLASARAHFYGDAMDPSIAIPRLGCGTGGLDWDTQVEPLVRKHLDRFTVTVCDGRLVESGPVAAPTIGWQLWRDYGKPNLPCP